MSPQDSFIDDDEDSCPLCVEEFDLSDKNFWPCPCGYQICQFCYNNIKNNINGLCPACRRPYDEKNIEWKVVTPEEIAQFKANVQKNAKKKQEQRQKEAQKREVESMNRKHLSGLRVVQKNLVYVVGISSAIPEQEILSTLRGEKYFGQYGKIVKIVVSNKKQGDPSTGGQSLGVYVTFARKEDAARCIAAVNGSQNGDRVLRAQLGTTKYCSAYLRNETCTNKNCMFLHEPGDNDDSYSRQDLSSINSVNQERQFSSVMSGATSSRQSTHSQSLYTSNSQTMARECSKDGSENGDGSALPSSASWANRGLPQRNRRDSHSTNGATSSPAISHCLPATIEVVEKSPKENQPSKSETPLQTPSDSINNTEGRSTKQDTLLLSLLAAINSPLVSFPPPKPAGEIDNYNKFPPLFDEWGGRKRKAMREQLEDSRKNLAKNFQEELQTMPELLEEEEPESGSLQLGGEPEDQDTSREGTLPTSYHNQRQSSSQVPIQRFANNGPFGPRLGPAFPKNLSNLNSVNGRALTPLQQQQFLLMKTGQQSEYMDQYPPGIGNQYSQNSTSFQHHSNGRQASRYNFNNDASISSTAAKTPTNSKIMSQQSSMMSSGNLSQQAGFYPSIQGPPPGLKSTSTPPTNGSMFTQNLGFGNSVSGALLGGIQKENSGDMLRDMIRGRGVASGSQAHDSGKREYMFPSFLHQYPSTSSTSATAPSMASIYGPQTGAFHDFGQKQKKKGKKHRHVNTSSSGGGGLIDLADPSILQAGMQHQQQTNSGVGQGLFGGQAQDDQLLHSFDDARSSVDALVGDNTVEYYGRAFDAFSQISRCSTPLIPPGFGSPHVNPTVDKREESIPRYPSRIVPTSALFTPRRNFSSTGIQQVQTTPALTRTPIINSSELYSTHQKEIRSQKLSSSRPIKSQPISSTLQSEDFPALKSGKAKTISPPTSKIVLPSSLVSSSKQPNSPVTLVQTAQAPNESRATPTLTSSIPTKPSQKGIDTIKSPKEAAAFPPLPASTTPIINAQVQRNIPKTLRLTSTPKPEPVINNITSSSSLTSSLTSHVPVSRHPSLTSNIRLESPDTPTSEMVSDNASITSTSLSRANSPPPTRVGSAPVRTTTKSSQKKQRQAQKEKGRAGIEAIVTPEPEVEIAPIMGRKKKQKKDRVHRSTSGLTPALSRPQSPGTGSIVADAMEPVKEDINNKEKAENLSKEKITESASSKTPSKAPDAKSNTKDKTRNLTSTDCDSTEKLKIEEEPTTKPPPTPAAIFQKLLSTGAIKDPSELAFLKNISSSYRHIDLPDISNGFEINPKLIITPEEHETLLAGKPVHKISEAGHRIMLTPNGDCVRNLTEQEEKLYLEYQSLLAKSTGPAMFLSAKHTGQNGFTMIGGRAVPSGPPSYFPTPNKGNGLDAVSKIQRDEALNYINQYVLPTLSNNTQLDKTFNASAIQGEMMRGTAPLETSWKTWGPYDRTPTSVGTGDFYMGNSPNNDGMIDDITTHFAIGDINRQNGNDGPNTTTLLSLPDAESAMQLARKEAENLEKKLNSLIKKNRKMLLGAGH